MSRNGRSFGDILCGLIARILAHHWVRYRLVAYAKKRPFSHIGKSPTEIYMRRYWLFNKRWRIPFLPAIRIHHIMLPDDERELHDHPFDFRSFIIAGEYVEVDLMGNYHIHEQGTTYFSRAERFHRITQVSRGGVHTLVICGRKGNVWGFLAYAAAQDVLEYQFLTPKKIHHRDHDNGMRLFTEEEVNNARSGR